MSITAETAKSHANDPAVLCCRAEEGITIEAANLEDPAIFDECSGRMSDDRSGVGSKVNKDERFLMPADGRECGRLQGRGRR